MSLPTLTDLKAHNNQTATADDDELQEMLDAAVDVVRGIVGPVGATPTTETHYGVSSAVLVLRQSPVSSVSSIAASYFGGLPATMDASSYVLDPATGIVRMVTGGRFVGDVTVTYTAGSDDLSAALRLAILIIAAHLWQTQRGGGSLRPTFPGEDALDEPGASFSGYSIPNRARELLAPYMRPSIA